MVAERRAVTTLLGIGGVAAVGAIDYVTGYEVRLFPLYFLPVAYVAWRGSRLWAMTLAVMSAGVWVLANAGAGRVYSSAWIWPINFVSQLVAFATVGGLVAQLRRRLEVEQGLSRHDALTALPNRRAFHEGAELLLAVARRSERPVTFAYVDLDHFKSVNDSGGHAEGDRALIAVAAVLRQNFRTSDLVARLGGDEFSIILHDAGSDSARIALERFRSSVAEEMRRHAWPITASVGAVVYTRAAPPLTEIIRAADALMYRAKQGGKDVLVIEVDPPA